MRKIRLLTTLVFSLMMFSSTSYAEWTKVGVNVNGNTFYVDFAGIRKVDGYVYYWYLQDWLKPNNGFLSGKSYFQGECRVFRVKYLSYVHHKQPMGRDTGDSNSPKNPECFYPPSNSVIDDILKKVCTTVQNYREQ